MRGPVRTGLVDMRPGVVDDEDDAAVLIGANRVIRNQDPLVRQRTWNVDAAKHARLQNAVLVGKAGAYPHRAGRLVDAVVGEVELALEWFLAAIGKTYADVKTARAFLHGAAALPRVARIGEIRPFIDVEVEVDRIDRHDRCQQGRIRLYEVADRYQPSPDAARRAAP